MTPEDLARQQIDQLLQHAGWEVQDRATVMITGEADNNLLVDCKALGAIERLCGSVLKGLSEGMAK